MSDELERVLKEVVTAKSRYYPIIRLKELRKPRKTLIRISGVQA
jgi:hypothetical protein